MAHKRYSEEDILRLLREIEVHLSGGMDVITACRAAGISDKTYYD
jgi:putative transposase